MGWVSYSEDNNKESGLRDSSFGHAKRHSEHDAQAELRDVWGRLRAEERCNSELREQNKELAAQNSELRAQNKNLRDDLYDKLRKKQRLAVALCAVVVLFALSFVWR